MKKGRKWTFVAVAGLAAVTASAQDSYELLLVADGQARAVHRYDPVAGRYLGSFGSGYLMQPAHVAADPTTGIAYVTDYYLGAISRWNYSTGAYLGEIAIGTVGWGIARMTNGNLLVGASTGAHEYSTSGTFLRTIRTGTSYGVGVDGSNLFVASEHYLHRYNTTGALLGSVDLIHLNAYQVSVRDGVGFATGIDTTSGRITRFNPYAMTLTGTTTVNMVEGRLEGHAHSHGLITYVAGFVPGGTTGRIARFNRRTNGTLSYFGGSELLQPNGMTLVMAPEPGTMVALGAGLAAVVARRRRRSR